MLNQQLISFNKGRLPEMIQLKYEVMTENAFRFFRGTCHLFYERLAALKNFPASPLAWICGDLHLENFGSFKGSNHLVYFDLNDFDEGILAPALWEVIRLVTSIFVAFGALEIGEEQATNLALLYVNSYAGTLCKGKAIGIEPRTAKGIVKKFLKHAQTRNYNELLEKRTKIKGKKIILSLTHERHFKLDKTLKKELMDHIDTWIATSNESPYNYKVKDVVFRFAGTGSVGVKRYLFLLKSTNAKNDFLLLDMKQSFESSLMPCVNELQPKWKDAADRILAIQERMQNVTASLLGRTNFNGDCYVLQELQPMEDTFDFKMVNGNYRNMLQAIDDMAILTASSQLRSGGMDGSATIDALKAFGAKVHEWRDEVIAIAKNAALQNEQDYNAFIKDYKNGVFANQK
ncbi:DUF2252 domain-containing protein [Pedobacter frigiditerrae]|uniref:DUF2252 domain-containing protein n=1 Tax=Pedobacter frigiditerrae TaxID=2530452 RepID=A0A4R0MMV1_9SPHI|nr:DUF2252 family protein [Pedobacter frigiditerrae]TCC88068.1 DUF2252 domain-containing protein [Pedobacter frigiditerrae]